MKVLESNAAQGFLRMCEDGWTLGVHECHGGNVTYRLSTHDVSEIEDELVFNEEWYDLPVLLQSLAEDYFMVTGSGKFMRNLALDPEDGFGIIQINREGNAYRKVWGLVNGGMPTSELPAHLMNQQIKKEQNVNENCVIYHSHPVHLIALTFILPLEDAVITRSLWEMMPECAMTFPKGIGVLP